MEDSMLDKTDVEAMSREVEEFDLNAAEVETLQRAAEHRCMEVDPDKQRYTKSELSAYGLVREAYTTEELRALGFGPERVTSFDEKAALAQELLKVDTPFGSGIRKWQLPCNMIEMRVHETVFPPNSFVQPHVHPINTEEDPGGSLRIVVKGHIKYAGQVFGPGDWFYVPNGVPYSFSSAPDQNTHVMYLYRFFAADKGNRLSHPHSTNE
jgi:hypothetical protein